MAQNPIIHHPGDRLTQTDRYQRIAARIRQDDYPSQKKLAKLFGVSLKTLERDLQYLRFTLGAPLAYDESKKGWHYTEKDFVLPSLFVTNDEFQAVLVLGEMVSQHADSPMGDRLKAVFDRLLGLFDAEDSKRLRLLAEKFAFAQLPPSPVKKDVWGTILKALQEQERLEIVYKAGGRGQATTRRYDAYGLIVRDRDWYVIGHCHFEKGLRTLGLPFIQEAKPIDEFFDIPKTFNLKNYAKTGFHAMHSEKEPVQEVVLRFDPEVAGRVQARPFTVDQKAEEEPSGHLTVRFKTSALFRVEREVLSWGTNVEVRGPKDLRNRIKQISEELARKYKD